MKVDEMSECQIFVTKIYVLEDNSVFYYPFTIDPYYFYVYNIAAHTWIQIYI